MKLRILFLFFILGIFLSTSLLIAQTENYPTDLTDLNKITTVANPDNWQNLAQTWKQEILSNSFVSSTDSFLHNINPVFLFLTGEPYNLSLFFFFLALLWIFFVFQFRRILHFSLFSSAWVCWIIAIGLSIVLGQMGLYKIISNFFVYLIYLPKTPWIGILIFVGIIIGLIFIAMLGRTIEKISKKGKEQTEKIKEKSNRKILDTVVKGIEGGLGEK